MAQTKLTDLVNPQVMAAVVRRKLVNDIKFAPLCTVDTTLVGTPGNTITLPSFGYIGDATAVAEGTAVNVVKLSTSTATATIAKAGIGVELTDEAVLSGYGDPLSEAANQIRLSIASKVDNDILTVMSGATLAETATAFNSALVSKALIKFGEDIDGDKVLLVGPEQYDKLRTDPAWIAGSDIGANIIINGTVGMIYGCQVVVSNKLTTADGKFYIVKPGALALYLKRDIMLESDRDIINKTTVITADQHYVGYLYDASKIIKITVTAP